MDQRVKHYLIRAHNKVIAHYRKILEADFLTQMERERVKRNLIEIEFELAAIMNGWTVSTRLAVAA